MVVPLLVLSGVSLVGASGAAPTKRAPRITLLYTTAETTTSAAIVWNTDVAADSRVQYSTTTPIPESAPTSYSAHQVTYHEFTLSGLAPGTLYYFKVTSCNRRGCVSATGSFDTYPSCPDTVPPVSGAWQQDVTPNVGAVTNEFLGIDAVSAADVWAVGWAQDPDGPPYIRNTFIQHFDGGRWSIVPSPNSPGDYFNELHAVSGVSASDVWAVGGAHNGSAPSRTMIQRWDGVSWTIVPSPSPADQLNALHGVAGVSANDVWAVGYMSGAITQNPIDTLVLHWDGISWKQVPSPNIIGAANQLFGIAAISANDIWAVGFAGGTPLAMRWNGSVWSLVHVPSNGGMRSETLAAIAAASSDDVWAVGRGTGVFSNRASATLRHWNGVYWTEKVCRATSTSNPPDDYEGGGPDSYFTGVSAVAANDVWVVGVAGSGPIILHWDGSAWTRVTHPRAFPNSAVLRAVTTSSDGSAWSAGIDIEIEHTTSHVRTLIHRYTP
jgi:hypothetical protein